jgi:glucoamylase
VGLVPEQVWEDPDLPASPYGSDPTTASIGFADGHAAGSASPLTWAQAQRLRLIQDIGARQITERPSITTARYVTHKPPAAAPLTLTSPTSGATVEGTTVTVTGTTSPGAQVTVQALPTDLGTGARTVSTRAGSSGAFSVKVPIGFGTDVITASATGRDGSTGHAQVTVVGNVSGGTTNLDVTDPAGDDHGPGTYQYPTASDFKPGSYDLTGFQVITSGDTVYLRTRLATLVPTFGNTMGAQLLDIYVHTPAGTTSTAAAYPSRHYTIAAKDAWSQRIEVQGFAAPVWVDASGHQVGTPSAVVASTAADTITIALPKAAFGTPASGWSFTVVLAGQDGYSSDQARAFAATPQPYAFGVCAPGGTSSICSVDPATVPKVMDVLTPPGVQQSTELDPTRGPVVISGVPVP